MACKWYEIMTNYCGSLWQAYIRKKLEAVTFFYKWANFRPHFIRIRILGNFGLKILWIMYFCQTNRSTKYHGNRRTFAKRRNVFRKPPQLPVTAK
jgi:hypothetical protein